FTMSSLAALHASPFAQGFSNNERQAAGRALFGHDMHIDCAHYHARKLGGLHPAYAAFNQTNGKERTLTHVELVEAALRDLFDAVTMQDRIDGGISLLIRCPGSEVSSTTLPEELALDLYITPHELQETPQCIGGDVATLLMGGAATNHKQQVSEIRSKIRDIINTKLQLVTGDPDARMQWTHYFRNVVQRYQVAIEGWPDNIPFTNLSQVSSA
ncbi:hypothetical protein EV424DRAFT_1292587, partial [Suillus variegatus]